MYAVLVAFRLGYMYFEYIPPGPLVGPGFLSVRLDPSVTLAAREHHLGKPTCTLAGDEVHHGPKRGVDDAQRHRGYRRTGDLGTLERDLPGTGPRPPGARLIGHEQAVEPDAALSRARSSLRRRVADSTSGSGTAENR